VQKRGHLSVFGCDAESLQRRNLFELELEGGANSPDLENV
jgi:hypothetical protein